MQPGSKALCLHKAKGLRQLPGQGQRLTAPLQRLVRIAQRPQGTGRKGSATNAGVFPIEEGVGAVLLGVVEGYSLLQMGSGGSKLSQIEQAAPHSPSGPQEEGRVVLVLR